MQMTQLCPSNFVLFRSNLYVIRFLLACIPCREYKGNPASFYGVSTAKSAYKAHVGVKREPSYKPNIEYKVSYR